MKPWIILFTLLALPMACSSPEPAYYTLVPVPGSVVLHTPHAIVVNRIKLAGYLDRIDIILSSNGVRLRISDTARWSEPLDDMATRILSEDLTQRLPDSTVFSESSGISVPNIATTVTIDIQRFDADSNGRITLLAQSEVSHNHTAVVRSITLSIQATSPGTAGMASCMSRLLGQIADNVVSMLQH
jgi:uncharacterized protein